ncbi:hypothetical protein ACFS3C_00680 [Azotobacter vinelandii]
MLEIHSKKSQSFGSGIRRDIFLSRISAIVIGLLIEHRYGMALHGFFTFRVDMHEIFLPMTEVKLVDNVGIIREFNTGKLPLVAKSVREEQFFLHFNT